VFVELERPLSKDTYLPRVVGGLGYAFAAKRGQYRLEMEQPVLPRHRVTVGAAAYRAFRPFFYQDEALSSEENTASAFFLHRDYWDWYEAEGVRGTVGFYFSPFMTVTVGVVREDEASLVNHADWSVFRQTKDFETNIPIPDGEYRGYEAAATYDTRPHNGDRRGRSAWGGMENFLRVKWERAGAGLGGDVDQWRVSADLRNYFRISSRQSLATRILAGTGHDRSGLLAPQRRFAVGGLGTLRGHLYRDLRGDHLALANLEYSFDLGRRSRALLFVDTGTAWDAGSLTDQRIPIDVGTGFRFGQDGLTLLLAQTVNESHADPKVYIRLGESF
jgi:outer membrane protein assembly factor BamA